MQAAARKWLQLHIRMIHAKMLMRDRITVSECPEIVEPQNCEFFMFTYKSVVTQL
jgi:hypothetical protein